MQRCYIFEIWNIRFIYYINKTKTKKRTKIYPHRLKIYDPLILLLMYEIKENLKVTENMNMYTYFTLHALLDVEARVVLRLKKKER